MHFVWAAATDALGSRMCRWWFARARKLHYSLRLALLYKFVGETAAALNLQYNAFFFLFTEGSMKFVGGMHHHKYNGTNSFLSLKWICHWFFPLHLYRTHYFVNINFPQFFFSLVVAGRKKLKYHWNHLNFAVGFLFHPENFFSVTQSQTKRKKNSSKSPVRLVSLWYNFFMSLGK